MTLNTRRKWSRRGFLWRVCLVAPGAVLLPYVLWTLWTGWLGPDRVETRGASFLGRAVSGYRAVADFNGARDKSVQAVEALLRRPVPRSLERPAVGSDEPEVAAGLRLPREYDFDAYRKYKDSDESPGTGDFVVRNAAEFGYRERFRLVFPYLWARGSPDLAKWLLSRADLLPPRRVDTVIYCETSGVVGSHVATAFTEPMVDAWRRMATARNPYYRWRSVQLAHQWARDPAEESEVYRKALLEHDERMLLFALMRIQDRAVPSEALMSDVERAAREQEKLSADRVHRELQQTAESALKALRRRSAAEAPTGPGRAAPSVARDGRS